MKYLKVLFTLIILITAAGKFTTVNAQNIPAGTSIDQYSDAQLKLYLQQAQAQGLSDAQIIQQAQTRGLSADQVAKLQQRIASIRKTGSNNYVAGDTTQSQSRKVNYGSDTISAQNSLNNGIKGPQIFGADLFRNGTISSAPNLRLATPVNYILGPDDQLRINVYGNSIVNWNLNVTPEGNINIPGVGPLNVVGKTIEQATQSIKTKLAVNKYAIGKGTDVKVTLGDIRTIKVRVVGEVVKPNTYNLQSFATVFDALYSSGGPSNNGTFRQIEIIRGNQIIRKLDVYDFIVSGSQKDNISLKDQDIIRVPTYRTRVELSGEVKIPALFEVLPGETLQNVIDFAGGFTEQAYTARIKVQQVSDQQRRLGDIIESDYKNYIPLRGDKYIVDKILDRYENRVTISGAVFRPDQYELQKGLTISQLIKNAGGIKEDAFTGRGNITRLKPDNTTEQVSFDVLGVINHTVPDITLQREDVVNIASIFDLRDKYTVNIQGEVRNAGQFAYEENMTVQDLIIKAGGLSEGASPKRIEVARRVTDSNPLATNSYVAKVFNIDIDPTLKNGDTNFKLVPYDQVSVYMLPGYQAQKTVKIEGEVLLPGPYTIEKKNEKISDIIVRAGGLTASADVEGGTLKRSNIAILGIDKSKVDTTGIEKEHANQIKRLQQANKATTNIDSLQTRNDYVGIDLKKILEKPGTSSDLILEDGDILRIPKKQQIVRVNGEVLYPSAVVFEKGKAFSSYVSNAGGYSPKALKSRAYIVYPNGTVKGTHKFLFFNSHPSVRPGSEIYVPLKPEKKGLGATEVVGITTGVASIGAVLLGVITLMKK
ncbi:SLBB domain-containing protein [Mucilaginibacter mali]|uniref:SLBB domain-containing protein n=1 Tax=Mucilaginibacter mali TaxID=2740462 RepID=A0A7D4PSV0_9SPHI|nr:SLBB domain-containing protein [Mucilaginibacter mali]QKJ29388.1 SLBB domain-containing protein [Mucilaginibacter mali]